MVVKQSNPGTTEPSTDASCTCGQVRLIGADRLRLATLLSIVFFHVVLTDLQFAHVTSAPDIAAAFDSLVVVSTVFDNRSLVILSFFLLFIRERDTP